MKKILLGLLFIGLLGIKTCAENQTESFIEFKGGVDIVTPDKLAKEYARESR